MDAHQPKMHEEVNKRPNRRFDQTYSEGVWGKSRRAGDVSPLFLFFVVDGPRPTPRNRGLTSPARQESHTAAE